MEDLAAALMALALAKPLSRRLTPGVRVMTPRGYGVIADVFNADGPWGASVIVELDGDGVRATFTPRQLQVVEHVG